MRYIYMDNFRGFSETLVPLRKINFLVGENSTGKSSFLSLLAMVNHAAFWFDPSFVMHNDDGPSSFGDLISAWSKDKTNFRVGIINTEKQKSGATQLSFNIHEFAEHEDSPRLIRHSKLSENKLTTIVFEKTKTKYRISDVSNTFENEDDAISEFRGIVQSVQDEYPEFNFFPKYVPANPPLPMATSILKSLESGESVQKAEFKIEIPARAHVTWIAPIRSKPRRIYDGVQIGYSPEGEHAPLLLRKTLKSRKGSKQFAERLAEFGKASGLFETVIAHSFGTGAKNPFELIIRFQGAELNINNVGYGVSQALPLIVEFLTKEKRSVFAVQQPEVHLHPRAQAALGGLVFELAHGQNHSFFIETHSDYLIDRYRLSMRKESKPPESQMLFFIRTPEGNKVHALPISSTGHYPSDQPREFRDFFVKEELKLLDI